MFSHPSTLPGLINWISLLSVRFAVSLLANLPGFSILASWQKCENSNSKPDFLKMGEDLTESSICTLLNTPLALILDSVSVQGLLPKGQSHLKPSKPLFSIMPTLSDQTEPSPYCEFRFSVWATAVRQAGDTSTRGGHKDNVLGWSQLQLRARMSKTMTLWTPPSIWGCIFHTNSCFATTEVHPFLCNNAFTSTPCLTNSNWSWSWARTNSG